MTRGRKRKLRKRGKGGERKKEGGEIEMKKMIKVNREECIYKKKIKDEKERKGNVNNNNNDNNNNNNNDNDTNDNDNNNNNNDNNHNLIIH